MFIFIKRLISSFILIIILLLLFLFQYSFLGLLLFFFIGLFLSIVLTHELSYILQKIYFYNFYYFIVIFSLFIYLYVYNNQLYDLYLSRYLLCTIVLIYIICCVLIILLLKSFKFKYVYIMLLCFLLNFCLVILPMNLITVIYMYKHANAVSSLLLPPIGIRLLFFMLFVVKSGDIGGYFFGKILCNKTIKIMPNISPNKSLEGLIGGLCFTIVTTIYLSFVFNFIIINSIVVGLIMFFCGILGDLIISKFKRLANVKDTGYILPGIGGILDFFDSIIISTIAFFYLYIYL